ncbi:MAG: hypothetical protein QOD00_1371, partial [Blastocatellia bacterium]|nr:hypothetical protein [Blastocatellia bacterium]
LHFSGCFDESGQRVIQILARTRDDKKLLLNSRPQLLLQRPEVCEVRAMRDHVSGLRPAPGFREHLFLRGSLMLKACCHLSLAAH